MLASISSHLISLLHLNTNSSFRIILDNACWKVWKVSCGAVAHSCSDDELLKKSSLDRWNDKTNRHSQLNLKLARGGQKSTFPTQRP